MGKLERALTEIQSIQSEGGKPPLTPLCMLLIVTVFLIAMLSVPISNLTMLLWFAIFPIIGAPLCLIDFTSIFLKSLIALPFAALIGIFNPLFDTTPGIEVAGIPLSNGWLSFIAICLRALLSVQVILILTISCGFIGICNAMRRIGIPKFLTTQLLMVFRYLTVLLEESLDMRRAREARGYGKKNMPIRMWGAFTGQLFLRTLNRADNIHRAMLARGFDGTIPSYSAKTGKWHWSDTIALIISLSLFVLFRFYDLSSLLGFK